MNCLVIGYGSAGKRHTRVLDNLKFVRDVHVVSNQKVPTHRVYKSIAKALQENVYDYFVVASATARHKIDLQSLLARKITSPILIEKPLFHKFFKHFPVVPYVHVAYNLRFHPAIVKLKQILGSCGEIYAVTFYVGQYLPNWRSGREYYSSYSASAKDGGGVLLDLSHEVDLLQMLFGEIRQLTGLRTKRSALRIDSEDIASLSGITVKKTVFSINMDYLSFRPIRNIVVQSSKKTLEIDLVGNIIQTTTRSGATKKRRIDLQNPDYTYEMMHRYALAGQSARLCSMNEGRSINYWIDQLKRGSILEKIIL